MNTRVKYSPTLYAPFPKQTPYKTLNGRYVKPQNFNTMKDASMWVEQHKNQPHMVYGNTLYAYSYLSEEYPDRVNWNMDNILLITLDIEVECENGFPNVEQAIEPLISITIKNHQNKRIMVWGIGGFKTDRGDVGYVQCQDEKELIQGLILVAAALVHYQKYENKICLSVLNRALKKLHTKSGNYHQIDIDTIKQKLFRMLDKKEITIFAI